MQVDIRLTLGLKALGCQPVESTSLSKFWFQMSTCTPTSRQSESQVILDIAFKWGGNPDVEIGVKLAGGLMSIPVRLAQLQVELTPQPWLL